MPQFNERLVDELLALESCGVNITTEAFQMAMEAKEEDYECMKDADIVDTIILLTMIPA